MNDLICDKLKEIVNLHDIVETVNLRHKTKSGKVYNFSEYVMPIVFLRDIDEWHLSLKDDDDQQSNFAAKIKNLDNGKKTAKNSFFKITQDYYLAQEKMLLITLKADYFQ